MNKLSILYVASMGLFAASLVTSVQGIGVVQVAHADYSDSRDIESSKAKSQLKGIRKEFTKLDEAINDPRKLNNSSYFGQRAKSIERNLERAADKDPTWNLSVERAYYAAITQRWTTAQAAAKRQAMEASEPEIGDWDIPAFAGAPKIAAGKPTWCAGVEVSPEDNWIRAYSDLATNWDDDTLLRAAQHACRAPDFKKRQAWTRVWRQALANKTGASAKLTASLYALWMKAGGRHGDSSLRDQTCTPYGHAAHNRAAKTKSKSDRSSRSSRGRGSRSSSRSRGGDGAVGQRAESEMDQAFKKATAYGLGCDGNTVNLYRGNINVDKLAWWIDQGSAPPSELIRAVYILKSVGPDIGENDLSGSRWQENALKALGTYALVAADVQKLNSAVFEKELKAMGLNEWGQVMARITFSKAQHVGRIYKAAYSKMDRGIQELAFQTPVKAFAAWEKLYTANKEGLSLARSIQERALSGRTQDIRNCHGKAHAALAAYMKGKKPAVESREDRKAAFDDPIANILLQTSMVCAAYEGQMSIAANLYNKGLVNSRTWRGPRFAAYYAMLERYGDIKAKDPSFPLEDNQVGFWVRAPRPSITYSAYEQTFNKVGTMMSRSGRIKSAKKTPKGTKLTFKTESWKETIWDCKETRKIDRITSDGRIVYRQKCKAKGKKTVTSTVEPYLVPASLAAGLKPGIFVKASVEFGKQGNIGVPLVLFKSKKQEKVLGILGIAF